MSSSVSHVIDYDNMSYDSDDDWGMVEKNEK
jgi:hypothetical protein